MAQKPKPKKERLVLKAKPLIATKPPRKTSRSGHEENHEAEKLPQPETLAVPVPLLLAAETVAAKAAGAHAGVFIHRVTDDGKMARIVAYDGMRLFVAAFEVHGKMPSWLKDGIALDREHLKIRVQTIAKVVEAADVQISFAKGTPSGELTDPDATMSMKVRIVVGRTPKYDHLLTHESFGTITPEEEGAAAREWQPVGFNSGHLKHVGEVAKILEAGLPKEKRGAHGMVIRAFDGGGRLAPKVFDFLEWPGVLLVMGAVRMAHAPLPATTQALLAPAARLTVAALRAHATRWIQAAETAPTEEAKAEAMAKAEGFQQRVAAILGQVTSTDAKPALAGPETPAKLIGSDKGKRQPPPPEPENTVASEHVTVH